MPYCRMDPTPDNANHRTPSFPASSRDPPSRAQPTPQCTHSVLRKNAAIDLQNHMVLPIHKDLPVTEYLIRRARLLPCLLTEQEAPFPPRPARHNVTRQRHTLKNRRRLIKWPKPHSHCLPRTIPQNIKGSDAFSTRNLHQTRLQSNGATDTEKRLRQQRNPETVHGRNRSSRAPGPS